MQSFTQIQQVLESTLAAAVASTTIAGISRIAFYSENDVLNFAKLPDISTQLALRTTLVPAQTVVETLGSQSYVSISGMYIVDVFGAINQGYLNPSLLGDAIMAAFPRGMRLTLTNGDILTVSTSTPSPLTSQGAYSMGKLYCRQIAIKFFLYVQP